MRPEHVLLILVDGVGLPDEPLPESVYRKCPALCRLFTEHTVGLDATLGVAGLPQSATGQATILTGINAAALIGAHQSGFPDARLRQLVERENLFLKLQKRGLSCTFANAYASRPEIKLPPGLRSVTTVASQAAFAELRNRADLLAGRAVYHDPTRNWLRERGDAAIPAIDEATAAGHLLSLARNFDFTLFEYFLTDHAGHRGTAADQARVLLSLDRFMAGLLEQIDVDRELLLLVSDHGNIENLRDRFHSVNPVPWSAFGRGCELALREIVSLFQVAPRILELLIPVCIQDD